MLCFGVSLLNTKALDLCTGLLHADRVVCKCVDLKAHDVGGVSCTPGCVA
jgi:hypothetical protein